MKSLGEVWAVAGLMAVSACAASAEIKNRAPLPGEVGYRPSPGEVVRLNPPSLVWLHEREAQTYSVQWAGNPEFKDAETASDFRWNTYTHCSPLSPGTYFWRYRFKARNGELSNWSQVRTFIVPPGAVDFPMPTVAQQRQRVPQGHPRLFVRPEGLPVLRELARGQESARFAGLLAEAERHLAAGPTPEPAHLGSARDKDNKELIKYWWPNREQTLKACQEAETLAFVYLMTGEPKYAEAARRWILHLAAWNPDGPTNFRLNCEAAKPLLYRLPRAYDWAYAALTPADRDQVRTVMRRRAQDAWESGEVAQGVGHLNNPFNSHGNRTWHKLGECGIAFLGEIPEAEVWLDYAVNKFYACYPVWADDDGGWHEGLSYWAGYLSKAVWWLHTAKVTLDIDGLRKPFFDQVGDFALYVAPPGTPNEGFGDLAHGRPSAGWGSFLEYFIRAKGSRPEGRPAGYWRWWGDQWSMRSQEGVLGFLYAASLPPLPAAKPPSDLPVSKVFRGIGVASLHSSLLDSRDDVHLLFKSSPFGTQSHGHNPHNSFQLNAFGEALLTTCVYRDLHGSPFHYQWAHSTRAHNALLVNGEGQIKHSPAPHGRIAEARLTPAWDYVAGEAAAAYGGRLSRYLRHVVFVKPDLVVICDEVAAVEPATCQFLLHALKPFEVDESASSLALELPKAGAVIKYLGPGRLVFRQWDGYEPKPDRQFPNQWHVEAGTTEKRKELSVFTIILPYRAGEKPGFQAERLESETAVGVRVTRRGQPTLVAFRKHEVQGESRLAGVTFNESVFVK